MASGRNVHPMEKFGELEPLPDQYHDRDARLRTMDEQGVERAVFFPTLGVGIDGLNADNVRMTYKVFRAFNLWLDDDWGFNRDDRIYAAPFIPMLDPQLACDELDSVLERGREGDRDAARACGRAVTRRPGVGSVLERASRRPASSPRTTRARCPTSTRSRSPTMWQRHGIGDPAYESNLELALNHLRPMLETCLALVLGNLFGRFPNLRVTSVELGSAWVDYCLYTLDHSGGLLGRHVEAYGVTVADLPVRHLQGAHLGVAVPRGRHPPPRRPDRRRPRAPGFGLAAPRGHARARSTTSPQLGKLDADSVRRIMRDNGLELLT